MNEEKWVIKILIIGKRRFHQDAMCGTIRVLECIVSELTHSKIQFLAFPARKENKFVSYLKLIVLLFKKWDVINVHLDMNFGVIIGLLRFRSDKVYLTVHGDSRIENPGRLYINWMHALQIKYLFKHRIYPSILMKTKIEEIDGMKGGTVIYNGIDENQLDAALSEQCTQKKDVDVFSLCGYGKNKGIDFLLDTLRLMPPQITFVIGGNLGRDNNYFSNVDRPSDSIKFRGSMNIVEIVDLLNRSKVYVQPSRFESFSIPVLEAMYCGTPVIVSTGAGVSELIEDGSNGFLVNYGDNKKLEALIMRIINGDIDYTRITTNAHETAQRYQQSKMAREYIKLFESTVSTCLDDLSRSR